MRFLVDAQLPRRFAAWLRNAGHDALHTLDLPEGSLLRSNLATVIRAFDAADFVEMNRAGVIVHG